MNAFAAEFAPHQRARCSRLAATRSVAVPAAAGQQHAFGNHAVVRALARAPATKPPPLPKPTFAGECDNWQRCLVLEALKGARLMVDNAVAELAPLTSGAVTAGRIVDLLNVHFHDPGNTQGRASAVSDVFRELRKELDAPVKFTCDWAAEECKIPKPGQVTGAATDCFAGAPVSICLEFTRVDCAERSRQLIHEYAHHLPDLCMDFAYVAQPQYDSLPAAKAAKNPDSYAQFASRVWLGSLPCVDCGAEVQAGRWKESKSQ